MLTQLSKESREGLLPQEESSIDLLRVQDLKITFPVTGGIFRRRIGEIKAVDGVNFHLARGETLGIVGESGSGKSTLARAILGLIKPTGGTISYKGIDLNSSDRALLFQLRRKLQIVFQNPLASLNPRLTIGEALAEPLRYHGLASGPEELQGRVIEILNRVGLSSDAMGRYPHEFSGGQQQRICIGRALVLGPELVICDEAVSALDLSIQAQILNLLNDLRERLQLSYLFISHDLSVIRYLSDRVLVLYLGKVMETASCEELFASPKHPYTQALLGAQPVAHPGDRNKQNNRLRLQGEIPSAINPPSGCPFRTRCPYAQPICTKTPPIKMIADKATGRTDHTYHCIL